LKLIYFHSALYAADLSFSAVFYLSVNVFECSHRKEGEWEKAKEEGLPFCIMDWSNKLLWNQIEFRPDEHLVHMYLRALSPSLSLKDASHRYPFSVQQQERIKQQQKISLFFFLKL
jgi:hypothetical protein